MLAEILRLDSLIADCLVETKTLKSNVVSLYQYEYAAQLRDFEKQFEKIKESLSGLSFPIIPSKGLTRNGAIYSSQLFSYGQSRNWKGLPDYICDLLKSRNKELNSLFQFSDVETQFFVEFNMHLKVEENRINVFINSLIEVYETNHLETIIDDFSYGGIVIQLLTSKEFIRSPRKDDVAKWSFYEIEISMEDWNINRKVYYDNNGNNYDSAFLNYLPIEVRNQQVCYLFNYLGGNGLLALQDMMNIGQVLVSFPFLCRLKRV
ncbi:MAG: hypothetical protein M3O71_01625 [Bacteroidota bacterium]|nr:hypothetical protein [Bacteroidota bacterium]